MYIELIGNKSIFIDNIIHGINIKSNIIKNLFTGSFFNNNTCCSLDTVSEDKHNHKLNRDYK